MKSKQKLLLIEDVESLGRIGEIVSVKAGYARNFLFPKKLGVFLDSNTLKMQEKLQKERAVRSLQDKKEAEELAKIIMSIPLSVIVKVDHEGKMYGSVSAQDIINLFEKHNIKLTKKNIAIKKPIKEIGDVEITIRLKEDVEAKVLLQIIPEKEEKPKEEKKKRSKKTEENKTEISEEEKNK